MAEPPQPLLQGLARGRAWRGVRGPGKEGAAAQGSRLTHLRLCLGGIKLGLELAQGALRAPILQVRLCVGRGWGCQQTSPRMPPLLGLQSFLSPSISSAPSN